MRGFQLHVAMWLTGSINPNSSLTSSGIEVRSWAPANVVNGGNGRCMFLRVPGGEVDPTGSISRQAGSDGGKRNSSPGRARHKPSNHCAGNAGVLRLYLYARVRSLCNICTRDRGCSKHPAFPAPSRLWRQGSWKSSGALRRENANAHSVVVTRLVRNCALGRVTQYSRDVSDGIDRPRRTGYPARAGYDGS